MTNHIHLDYTTASLERMSNPEGALSQYFAERYSIENTGPHSARPEYRLKVNFWNPADRDRGLAELLTAITSDGFAVANQSSNLLDLCEVELTLIQNEMEEVSLSQCARLYSRDGYLIAGGIEVFDRTEEDGGKWFRINCTLHEAGDCELIDDGQGGQLTLPCGEYLVW
jgi:hypothetical protein